MTRFFLLSVLTVVTFGAPHAEVVPHLHRGEAIVTGQDDLEERERGIRHALIHALIKLSGDDRVADHPELPAILADAETFVIAHEYEDRKHGVPISDEQGTRDRSFQLRVDFDGDALHNVLERLGFGAWHEDRPRLLVLLAVTDHVDAFVIGTEVAQGIGHREVLEYEAHRRGMPLVIPRMDSFEATAVSHHDVVSTHGGAVGALARAYSADAALTGAMTQSSTGAWSTDWTLLADDLPVRWRVPETTFDRSISQALGHSSRVLAGARQ